ncbi:MAG: acyltransferase family protein [Buchananella hordeovulneris]|nr:acyltransferase family protein [Buchananella hordeovulneris]
MHSDSRGRGTQRPSSQRGTPAGASSGKGKARAGAADGTQKPAAKGKGKARPSGSASATKAAAKAGGAPLSTAGSKASAKTGSKTGAQVLSAARAKAGAESAAPVASTACGAAAAPAKESKPTLAQRRHLAPLDGLRALAIALVLGYHFFPRLVPQGRMGVDLFFVLSGFLITSLLLGEKQRTGRIDFSSFFARRQRRLVPALAVTVVTTVAIAALVGQDALLAVRRQSLGSLFFVSNWVEILAGSSYYDHSQPLLLTNTWSLGIEAQFYLIWPFLLLGMLALSGRLMALLPAHGFFTSRRVAAIICVVLAALSLGWGELLTHMGSAPSRAYFGTDTHAFGLMLGAALALVNPQGLRPGGSTSPQRALVRGVIGWVSLVALLALGLGFGASIPGLSALVGQAKGMGILFVSSLLSVGVVQALLPQAGSQPGPARAMQFLVGWQPFVWIGQRSYGIYLWHWPLYVIAFYLGRKVPSGWVGLLITALSVALAALSYKCVEDPVRKLGWRGAFQALFNAPHQVFAAAILPIILVLSGFAWGLFNQPAMSQAQAQIEAGRQALASRSPATPPASAAPAGAPTGEPGAQATAPETAASAAPTTTPAPGAGEGPTASPSPTLTAPIPGSDVSVVGDSVTLASAQGLAEQLVDSAIDAEVSRHFLTAEDILAGLDANYGVRPFVVVSLFSNGPVSTEELEGFLSALAPERRLVLVTAYGPESVEWIAPNNEAIRQFAAKHASRVRVANWDTLIASQQDYLADDLIHPDVSGGKIYAQAVQEALDSFATAP